MCAKFYNTETTLIANAETKVTAQVLKDISVVGDVIISNVLNLGVDIVATRDVKESK